MNISLYEDSDFKIFSEYINKFFKPNYILGYKEYINWQYENSLYILKIENRVAGHFGFRDIPYKIGHNVENVRVLMNLFVVPGLRTMGAGAFLAKKVFDTPTPILVSGYTPISQKLFSYLSKSWKEAGNFCRFIKILNPGNNFLKKYNIPHVVPEYSRGKKYLKIKKQKNVIMLERAWLEAKERYTVTVERNQDYLKWRFLENPSIDYSVFTCFKDDSPCGFIIGRIESDQGFTMARIIDFITVEEAEIPLIENFVRWAYESDCDAVDFLFSGKFYEKSLKESGFFDVTDTDFVNFPVLFSPISNKKTFINIAHNLDFPLDQCYFNKADGDQDRPNPH